MEDLIISAIEKKLEEKDINPVMSGLDDMLKLIKTLIRKSLEALRHQSSNNSIFIAERVGSIKDIMLNELKKEYGFSTQSSQKFLYSVLMADLGSNDYIGDILTMAQSDDDSLALLCMKRNKLEPLKQILIEKLLKTNFSANNYDKVNFYFEMLKSQPDGIPDNILQKVKAYNESNSNILKKFQID